jgi:hypothetical protein
VLLVIKEEGDWQFLCGGEHDFEEIPQVVGFNHIIERDTTLKEILSLKDNNEAERDEIGGIWRINILK